MENLHTNPRTGTRYVDVSITALDESVRFEMLPISLLKRLATEGHAARPDLRFEIGDVHNVSVDNPPADLAEELLEESGVPPTADKRGEIDAIEYGFDGAGGAWISVHYADGRNPGARLKA